jgi:hypothetical protein
MTARGKRSIKTFPTGPQGRSRHITMPSERVLVKSIYRVASSRKGGEAGPGSKCEAGCEVVGRGMRVQRWWEVAGE